MKITHHMPNPGSTRRGFRVLLIGCGGNGSASSSDFRISTTRYRRGALPMVSRSPLWMPTPFPHQLRPSALWNCRHRAEQGDHPHQPRQSLSRPLMAVGRDILHEGCPNNTGSSYDNTVDFVISCVDTRTTGERCTRPSTPRREHGAGLAIGSTLETMPAMASL